MEGTKDDPKALEDTIREAVNGEKGYWNFMTPEQESALQELKEKLKDIKPPARYEDDARILRFLRARNFSVKNAFELIQKNIVWRKENNADEILETYPKTAGFKKQEDYWPARRHKTDKYGLPLVIERLGMVDPKPFMADYNEAQCLQFHIYSMEMAERAMEEASKKAGHPVDYGCISIIDTQGLGWKHSYSPAINLIKTVVAIDKDHYPEFLRKFIIVNCPKIFTIFWKIFKPLIDPRTVAKTDLYDYTSSPIDYLLTQMKPEDIPTLYGGSCPDHPDGCVPGGGEYKNTGEGDGHVVVNVKARSSHSVPIVVEKAFTSVLWDFSVTTYSIGFKVLYQKDDKTTEEVVEYRDVDCEEPCQGRLLCNQAGTYVLFFDNSFSKLRSKDVKFSYSILPPQSEEEVKTTANESDKKKKKKKKNKKKRRQPKPEEESTPEEARKEEQSM